MRRHTVAASGAALAFPCEPLRLVKQKSKEACTKDVSFGCYPGESRFWTKDKCLGSFQCGGPRGRFTEWCGECTFATGCTEGVRNCSCIRAPPLPRGVALQHPKPPRDELAAVLERNYYANEDGATTPEQEAAAVRLADYVMAQMEHLRAIPSDQVLRAKVTFGPMVFK